MALDESPSQGADAVERLRRSGSLQADSGCRGLGPVITTLPPGVQIASMQRWGTLARGPSRLGVFLLLTPRTREPFLKR